MIWKINHKPQFLFLVAVLLGIIFSLIYYYPILSSGDNLGIQDWDQNIAWTEFSRLSLVEYHEFPFWNPFKKGGMPHFANPQVPVISFQTLLAIIFGTVRGIKINIFLHGVIGFVGFYLLARQFKLSFFASLISATLFSYSGVTASYLSTGMIVFIILAYAPYIIFFLNKGFSELKWSTIAGIIYAFTFYSGMHIPLLLAVIITIYTFLSALIGKSLKPIKALTAFTTTAFFLTLPKLLLSLQLLQIYPRELNDTSGFKPWHIFYFMTSPFQGLTYGTKLKDFEWPVDESSLYVGLVPMILFFLFFFQAHKKILEKMSLLLSLVLLLWLMLGYKVNFSLFAGLRSLPIFSFFGVAERFRFDFIIIFSLLSGYGLDNLLRLLKKLKTVHLLAFFIIIFIFTDLVNFSRSDLLNKTLIFVNPEANIKENSKFSHSNNNDFEHSLNKISKYKNLEDSYVFSPWSNEYLMIKQYKGALDANDPLPVIVYALTPNEKKYQGEFFISNPDKIIKVSNTYWSPNKIKFYISKNKEQKNNTLIINQNYYPGWVVVSGNNCYKATNHQGLLATILTNTSSKQIALEFKPYLFYSPFCKNLNLLNVKY